MANERAGWKRNDEGAWALDVVNPPFRLIPTSGGVRLRTDYGFGGYLPAAEWRAMCALPVVPAEATPAIADGTSQPWTPPGDISRVAELEAKMVFLTNERDDALVRVGQLEAELAYEGERTLGHVDADQRQAAMRFELVKAALASGRDGWKAVRDADEALAAMGEREAPAKVARGQASFLRLFDGNLTADKVRAVAGLLRAGTEKMIEDDDDVPGWLDEVKIRLDAVASWLRGEGAEPPGTT